MLVTGIQQRRVCGVEESFALKDLSALDSCHWDRNKGVVGSFLELNHRYCVCAMVRKTTLAVARRSYFSLPLNSHQPSGTKPAHISAAPVELMISMSGLISRSSPRMMHAPCHVGMIRSFISPIV